MLFDDIHKLEKTWPDFNKESFTSEDIVTLAERIGIITITDKTIPYNPQQCETNLVMALGHELGHFGLGHVEWMIRFYIPVLLQHPELRRTLE